MSARDARPGLGRLTVVELRKMTDTRAGLWLLLSTGGLTLAVVAIACLKFPPATATCSTSSASAWRRRASCCRWSASSWSRRSGRSARR